MTTTTTTTEVDSSELNITWPGHLQHHSPNWIKAGDADFDKSAPFGARIHDVKFIAFLPKKTTWVGCTTFFYATKRWKSMRFKVSFRWIAKMNIRNWGNISSSEDWKPKIVLCSASFLNLLPSDDGNQANANQHDDHWPTTSYSHPPGTCSWITLKWERDAIGSDMGQSGTNVLGQFHRRSWYYSMKFHGSFFQFWVPVSVSDPFFRVLSWNRVFNIQIHQSPLGWASPKLCDTTEAAAWGKGHDSVLAPQLVDAFEGPPPFAATTKAGNVEKSTGA